MPGPTVRMACSPTGWRWPERGRLHGVVADGLWMHVGDPAARDAAEARLAAGR